MRIATSTRAGQAKAASSASWTSSRQTRASIASRLRLDRRPDAHQPTRAGLWRRHLRGRLGSRARTLPRSAIRRHVLVDAAEQVRWLVRQRHRRRRSLVGPWPKRKSSRSRPPTPASTAPAVARGRRNWSPELVTRRGHSPGGRISWAYRSAARPLPGNGPCEPTVAVATGHGSAALAVPTSDLIASSEFLGTSFIVEIEPSDAGFSTDPDCGMRGWPDDRDARAL